MDHTRPRMFRLGAVLVLTAIALIAGCSAGGPAATDPAVSTPTVRSPEQAVVDYLGAITTAYYSLESSAVATFVTPEQWVREDAYIELNRTQNEAIEMELLAFGATSVAESADSTGAVLETAETWRYRTWDLFSRAPKSDWLRVDYEVRYDLVYMSGAWLVDRKDVVYASEATSDTAGQ